MKVRKLSSILAETLDMDLEGPSYHSTLMKNFPYGRTSNPEKLPVTVKKESWSVLENPRRMLRRYEFKDSKEVLFFIKNLLDYENRVNHHAVHRLQGDILEVEIRTDDLDDITKKDVKYAKHAEKVFKDVQAIRTSREKRNKIQKENIDFILR